jgi:hypothetical protein
MLLHDRLEALRKRSGDARRQTVRSALYGKQRGLRRDQEHRGFQFGDAAEGIARSMNKQRGRLERGKMLSTRFGGLARRMQRIREQQQRIGNRWIFRGKHRTLPATVGVPRKA